MGGFFFFLLLQHSGDLGLTFQYLIKERELHTININMTIIMKLDVSGQ